jgi:hypothetical protein
MSGEAPAGLMKAVLSVSWLRDWLYYFVAGCWLLVLYKIQVNDY